MKRKLVLGFIIMAIFITISGCANSNVRTENSSEVKATTVTNTATKSSENGEDNTITKSPVGLNNKKETENNMINIKVGDNLFTATLVENSSTKALKEMLLKGPITINMRDYGNMEKVGEIGSNLPRNDESIKTEAGDLILYQGNALVIYYDTNSWNFTRLGKINNITQDELKKALGKGNATVTLSLA